MDGTVLASTAMPFCGSAAPRPQHRRTEGGLAQRLGLRSMQPGALVLPEAGLEPGDGEQPIADAGHRDIAGRAFRARVGDEGLAAPPATSGSSGARPVVRVVARDSRRSCPPRHVPRRCPATAPVADTGRPGTVAACRSCSGELRPPSVLKVMYSSPGRGGLAPAHGHDRADASRLAHDGDVLDPDEPFSATGDRAGPRSKAPASDTAAGSQRQRQGSGMASRSRRLTTMAYPPGTVSCRRFAHPLDASLLDGLGARSRPGRRRRTPQAATRPRSASPSRRRPPRGSWRGSRAPRRPSPPAPARPSAGAGRRPGTGRRGLGRPWPGGPTPSGGERRAPAGAGRRPPRGAPGGRARPGR